MKSTPIKIFSQLNTNDQVSDWLINELVDVSELSTNGNHLSLISNSQLWESIEEYAAQVGFDYLNYNLATIKELITYANIFKSNHLDSIADVFDLGELLIRARFLLTQGDYLKWLKAEFPWETRLAGYIHGVASNLRRSVLESIDNVSPSLLYFLAQPSTSVQCQAYVILMLDRGEKVSVKDFNLIRRFFQGEVKKLPSGYPDPSPNLLEDNYSSIYFDWMVDKLSEHLLLWEFYKHPSEELSYSLLFNQVFADAENFYGYNKWGESTSEILTFAKTVEYYSLEGKASHLLFNGQFSDFLELNFLSIAHRCLYLMFSYHQSEMSNFDLTSSHLSELTSFNYYFRGFLTTVFTEETFNSEPAQQWMIDALKHQLLTGEQVSFVFVGLPNKHFLVDLDNQLNAPSFIVEPNQSRCDEVLFSWEEAEGKNYELFLM